MSRYIDADAIQFYKPSYYGLESFVSIKDDDDLDIVSEEDIKDECPTADVVEVVRCKNCRHWHDDGIMTTCDKNIGNGYDAEYYCADGERKDGEEHE